MLKHSDIKYLVVHCSATKANADIGAREINQWHIDRGWHNRPGIGNRLFHGRPHAIAYNLVIRRDGTIEVGCPMDVPGYHARGYNRVAWSVCMVGGVDDGGQPENNFTAAQFEALPMPLRSWKVLAPDAEVLGHRDLSPDLNGDGIIQQHEWMKACPCFDVKPWWEKAQHP